MVQNKHSPKVTRLTPNSVDAPKPKMEVGKP